MKVKRIALLTGQDFAYRQVANERPMIYLQRSRARL
jgi:hypothetical protein